MGICSSCDTQPHCHNFHRDSTHYNSQQQKCDEPRNVCPPYYTHSVPTFNNWRNETCGYQSYPAEHPEEYFQPPQANNTIKHITVSSSPTNYYNH